MLHTLVPGVRFYRLTAPAKYLSSEYKHEIYFENTSLDGLDQSTWQSRAMEAPFHEMLERVLKGIDLLVIQLIHCDEAFAVLEGIRERFDVPIVLDLDDNVGNVPAYNIGGGAYKLNSRIREITLETLSFVDAVTVTTKYLAGELRKYNSNIHVLPNSIDFDLWEKPVELPHKKTVRIGWAAAQTHEDDIKMILPAIEEVLRLHKNVRFYFIGGVPTCVMNMKHKRITNQFCWYDILNYPKRMKQWNLDIGIAPLRDNAFNRSKSNLRWLEYSAMGIPTVASRVEPFSKSIADGKTGMLAYEPNEWVAALTGLIEDEKLRKRIGKNAHRKVKLDYNMKTNAKLWNDVYETVLAERKVKA